MDFRDCDDVKLGLKLKRLPLISMQLGHVNVKGTMRDYISPEGSIELEFVHDLFNLRTDEIIGKWYGSKEEAGEILMKLNNLMDPLEQQK